MHPRRRRRSPAVRLGTEGWHWDGWQRPLSFPWQRGLAPGSQRAPGRSSSSRKGSLRAEDALESIQELGSLELMGRDLGVAHYGPLRKSISADSLNSISSIGNNFGQDFTVGQVEVSMEYDGRAAALHVTLLQGKDLLEKEDARFESCFMRISLLPAEQIVGISRVSPPFPARPPYGARCTRGSPRVLGGSVPWPHSPKKWRGLGAGRAKHARIRNGWHRIWGRSAPQGSCGVWVHGIPGWMWLTWDFGVGLSSPQH